jgi:hypothetical protein
MALFIPEWTRASGRQLQLKRVLNALDEATIVRKPLREEDSAPDLFLEHGERGWLALACIDIPFAGLDARQLFAVEARAAFDARLAAWRSALPVALPLLLVLWACSEDEVTVLAPQVDADVRLLSRERFIERGAQGLEALQRPLAQADEDALRTRFFPESSIPLPSVARRRFRRSNGASLGGLFLDPQQEWASKLDLDNALPDEQGQTATDLTVRLVNGVAGSGKTLIALSRALLLAEMHPRERVLILIHNTPIVADIRERLHRAHGRLPRNLEITTYSAWIHRQWRRLYGTPLSMPGDPMHLPHLVRSLRPRWPDLIKLPEAQLIEEFDFLNEMLVASEAEYMDTSRAGRGFSLRAKERREVWALFEAVNEALRAAGLRMWSAVAFDVCRAPEHGALERYEHILVDEAQFFAPSWFHTVKLALKPQGRLFLCADPNQGFMKSRLSWRNAGLDVAGRTKKLLRSYRTTQAILHTAGTLLARAVQADPEDYLEPDFTGMEEGAAPILLRVDTPQDAVDRAVNEIVALVDTHGLPLSAFLVIYGGDTPKLLLYRRLCAALGAKRVWWLNKDKKQPPDGYGPDYLRLANLETATGLEGGAVFLLGMESLLAQGDAREADARKLYMAMTRASHRLVLLSTEELPADALPLFRTG